MRTRLQSRVKELHGEEKSSAEEVKVGLLSFHKMNCQPAVTYQGCA